MIEKSDLEKRLEIVNDMNLMNYKIVMDYAHEEMEKLGKETSGFKKYDKACDNYHAAKEMFIIRMNEFCSVNNTNIKF